MRHTGIHSNRLKGNPLEARFAEAWREVNEHGRILDYILGDGNDGFPASDHEVAVTYASDRDEKVAATVVQWLGSPVGQNFLSKVLGIQICGRLISIDDGKMWHNFNRG